MPVIAQKPAKYVVVDLVSQQIYRVTEDYSIARQCASDMVASGTKTATICRCLYDITLAPNPETIAEGYEE